MNTVGWTGGALGPLFVGWSAKHGAKASEIENMSDAIGFGSVVYVVAAGCLLLAVLIFSRQQRRATDA